MSVATMDLRAYLQEHGGQDILIFDTPDEASEAAWVLRESNPDVDVKASYNKVFLKVR